VARLPSLPAEPQAQLELVAEHLQATGHAFPVEAAQMTGFYRVFCAVVQATRAYRPQALPLDVLLLRARDGTVSEFAAHPCHGEQDWGWRALCRRLTLAHVPGNHHSLLGGESATLLGMQIEAWLAQL
jgi:thioesterase domain-containing protein